MSRLNDGSISLSFICYENRYKYAVEDLSRHDISALTAAQKEILQKSTNTE